MLDQCWQANVGCEMLGQLFPNEQKYVGPIMASNQGPIIFAMLGQHCTNHFMLCGNVVCPSV